PLIGIRQRKIVNIHMRSIELQSLDSFIQLNGLLHQFEDSPISRIRYVPRIFEIRISLLDLAYGQCVRIYAALLGQQGQGSAALISRRNVVSNLVFASLLD